MAFETRPVNSGTSVNSFDLQGDFGSYTKQQNPGNFTKIIEERLRARAGNPSINPLDESSKPKSTITNFGSGITENEIQKIIKEFNR